MTAKKKPNFTSLSAFQAEFNPDIKNPSKIKAGLAALLKEGKEAAEFETEFCARCGVASSQIGKYREKFAAHIVVVRPDGRGSLKNVWFADPKVEAKARG